MLNYTINYYLLVLEQFEITYFELGPLFLSLTNFLQSFIFQLNLKVRDSGGLALTQGNRKYHNVKILP